MKAKLVALLTAAAMCLALSGCASFGVEVETQLRPPLATGEQGLVETALAEYMASRLTQEKYVMKYPRGGENRSAFLLADLDGDGHDEALAFYYVSTENAVTHVNLLRQSEGKWVSVDDHEGRGTEIDSVCFGDVDGDGTKELFVCWDMYSAHTYQMSMYALGGNRISEKFFTGCARVAVADLTGDGRDDCVVLDAGTDALSARLWTMNDGTMEELGEGVIGGYAGRISAVHTIPMADGSRCALLMDCANGEFMYTTLIYWNGVSLAAPLYNADTGSCENYRPVTVPCGDTDRDGVWEWPVCTDMTPDDETRALSDPTRYFTTFRSWDESADRAVDKFSCIYNHIDGYYLLVDADFAERFATAYNEEAHVLWVYPLVNDGQTERDPLLGIHTVSAGQDADMNGRDFRALVKTDMLTYAVWYEKDNDYAINDEVLRYMLTLL